MGIKTSSKNLIHEDVVVSVDGIDLNILMREESLASNLCVAKCKGRDEVYYEEEESEGAYSTAEEEEDGGGRESEGVDEESLGQSQLEKGGSEQSRNDGDVSEHSQQNFTIREAASCLRQKGVSDPIENVQSSEEGPHHAINVPHAFIKHNICLTFNVVDVYNVAQSSKATIVNVSISSGSTTNFNSGEKGGSGLEINVDLRRNVPSIGLGLKDMGLLSFDKSCSLVRNPRRRKKKVLAYLGSNVEFSKSYFDCLEPRTGETNRRGGILSFTGNCSSSIVKAAGDQQISGESISCPSLTDTEIMRCDHRLINCDNSDVGRRVWESISNLGVVSKVETSMTVKLFEAMERRNKERLVGKKEQKNMLS